MQALLILIHQVIWLYIYLIIASAVLSWLIAFNVVNMNNRFIYGVVDALYKLTEPVLGPIRRMLPAMGGIDISPVILILGLMFVDNLMFEMLGPATLVR